jgi:hypothetical protein
MPLAEIYIVFKNLQMTFESGDESTKTYHNYVKGTVSQTFRLQVFYESSPIHEEKDH